MAKRDELARMLEVDAIYGEISADTAKRAKAEVSGCAALLIVSFLTSVTGWAVGAGLLLAGMPVWSAPLLVVGGSFTLAARYFKREMEKNDDILLAYGQRDRLKELRGDIDAPRRDARGRFLKA